MSFACKDCDCWERLKKAPRDLGICRLTPDPLHKVESDFCILGRDRWERKQREKRGCEQNEASEADWKVKLRELGKTEAERSRQAYEAGKRSRDEIPLKEGE